MKIKSIFVILALAFATFATIGCSGGDGDPKDFGGSTEQAKDPNAKGGVSNMQTVDPNK
jgi:hypothetical protein